MPRAAPSDPVYVPPEQEPEQEVLMATDLTARDYFAVMALSGFGAHPSNPDRPEEVATYCYKVADAMLEARNK